LTAGGISDRRRYCRNNPCVCGSRAAEQAYPPAGKIEKE